MSIRKVNAGPVIEVTKGLYFADHIIISQARKIHIDDQSKFSALIKYRMMGPDVDGLCHYSNKDNTIPIPDYTAKAMQKAMTEQNPLMLQAMALIEQVIAQEIAEFEGEQVVIE